MRSLVVGDFHSELGKYFLHVLLDAAAVVGRVVAKEVGGVIGGHELNGGGIRGEVVFVEPAP